MTGIEEFRLIYAGKEFNNPSRVLEGLGMGGGSTLHMIAALSAANHGDAKDRAQ